MQLPKNLTCIFITTRNSYFHSYKAWKNNYGSYLNFYKFFLQFELLPSNTIKNETSKKIKNLLGISLVKYSPKFLAQIKNHLGHTGTPTNFQNNCIKLSGFSVNITKFLLHREITRNISGREKFFNPIILSQIFRTNLRYFFHFLCRFISG